MTNKGRSKKNKEMLETLFLDGGNASYLEKMQAKYFADPQSVDPSWQQYFFSLDEDPGNAKLNANGPSWKSENWPKDINGEITSALTSDWIENVTLEKKFLNICPMLLLTMLGRQLRIVYVL